MLTVLPFILWSFLILDAIGIAAAKNISHDQVGSQSSSPYTILGCSDKHHLVESHIKTFRIAVGRAITDSSDGVQSRHGFQAFFKSNASMTFVQSVLLDVQSGRPLPVELGVQANHSSHPQIICATEPLDQTGPLAQLQPWEMCSTNSEAVGFHFTATPYIILCPLFWTLPAEPQPSGYDCGLVSSKNRFVGGRVTGEDSVAVPVLKQDLLVGYQIYHLFHEIIHFYLGTDSLSEDTVPEEVYDWNDCLALEASVSKLNPMNYQLYLANVVAGCTSFPKPPFRHSKTSRE